MNIRMEGDEEEEAAEEAHAPAPNFLTLTIRGTRIKWCGFFLWDLLDLPKHLTCGSLVESEGV